MKIFVYGTLKMGYWNNRILRDHKYLGDFVISGYKLLEHGRGSIPFAIPEVGEKIRGEVWDIEENKDTLQRLDRLEGHPDFYRRTSATTDDGQDVEFYVWNDAGRRQLMDDCPKNAKNEYYWEE